ncbi:hypothetical protein [Terasakiella sp.]|uniref:hypothetical protein n=1 Tax=Terasakiella sp. TaxID=2034861 RepID=UPI003AA7F1E8
MADDVFLQSYAGTIASGDLFAIHRRGRSIACIAASTDLEIVINDGSRSKFFEGMALNFDRDFEKVQIYNPSGAPATFEITTAMGRVDDNRLTASGDLNVIDPVTGDSFANVIASQADILAMMQDAENQRMSVGVIGASFQAGAGGTLTQIIDPTLNVNGAIVRTISVGGSSGRFIMFADVVAPSSVSDLSKRAIINQSKSSTIPGLTPLLVEAGVGVWIGDSGGLDYSITWDYL